MKQSIQLTRIQEQMKPGIITLDGFLGTDTRNLIDILVEDDGIVRRTGRTHRAIAVGQCARASGRHGSMGAQGETAGWMPPTPPFRVNS